MTLPRIMLHVDAPREHYCPGDTLSGEYWIDGGSVVDLDALEVSVLWHTEGKGDEDFGVHFFKRFATEGDRTADPAPPGRFSTTLPNSPLSYEGVLVKIRWCVRVRLFMNRGREIVEERSFRLGHVPHARAVLP